MTQHSGPGRLPAAYLTPGSSSFTEFLGDHAPDLLPGRRTPPLTALTNEAPHGTTIVALTFPGGVVMAGDRRATMGNYIAQRDIEKVFHADEFSCVGIAGAAGIAIEMVRLFQVELEHYEKIEGATLSLEGKANRLALMIRGNLGMAMQGMAVVPLFAGYDLDATELAEAGRLFSYDVTGGRYEEHQVPLRRLRLPVRARRAEEAVARRLLGRRRGALRGPVALRRGRRRLGHRRPRPDPAHLPGRLPRHRRRLPATLRRRGRRDRRRRRRGPDGQPGRPAGAAAMTPTTPTTPTYRRLRGAPRDHAVRLRLARAGDEGPRRLRPQGHRARPQRRRHRLRRRHPLRRREPLPGTAQDLRDLRPHRVRRGRQVQRVREPPDGRRPLRRPARLLLRPPGRHRPRAGQRLRPDARHDLHRRVQALRGRDRHRRGRRDRRRRPDLPADLRRLGRRRARLRRDGRLGRGDQPPRCRSATATGCRCRRRSAPPSSCSAATRCRGSSGASPPASSRSPSWSAAAHVASSAGSRQRPSPSCSASPAENGGATRPARRARERAARRPWPAASHEPPGPDDGESSEGE